MGATTPKRFLIGEIVCFFLMDIYEREKRTPGGGKKV